MQCSYFTFYRWPCPDDSCLYYLLHSHWGKFISSAACSQKGELCDVPLRSVTLRQIDRGSDHDADTMHLLGDVARATCTAHVMISAVARRSRLCTSRSAVDIFLSRNQSSCSACRRCRPCNSKEKHHGYTVGGEAGSSRCYGLL